jgi:hypothetical protein
MYEYMSPECRIHFKVSLLFWNKTKLITGEIVNWLSSICCQLRHPSDMTVLLGGMSLFYITRLAVTVEVRHWLQLPKRLTWRQQWSVCMLTRHPAMTHVANLQYIRVRTWGAAPLFSSTARACYPWRWFFSHATQYNIFSPVSLLMRLQMLVAPSQQARPKLALPVLWPSICLQYRQAPAAPEPTTSWSR